MSEHLQNLIDVLAADFVVLPALAFFLGMAWAKGVGAWDNLKFRKWWKTICLLMPFINFGMLAKAMSADGFKGLRAAWYTEPIQLASIIGVTALLSALAVVLVALLWRTSRL